MSALDLHHAACEGVHALATTLRRPRAGESSAVHAHRSRLLDRAERAALDGLVAAGTPRTESPR